MKKFNQTRLYSNNMIWSKSKQKLNENASHAHFSHVSNLFTTTVFPYRKDTWCQGSSVSHYQETSF